MLPLSGHDDVALLNDVANDTESTQKIKKYVIIASLKSETRNKLINRIPGSRILISSLPGSASRTHVESLGKPRDVNKRSQRLRERMLNRSASLAMSTSVLKALPGKLDIKRHSPSILYLSVTPYIN